MRMTFLSESFKTILSAGVLIPTLPPPQNRSTNTSMFAGNKGWICGNSLNFPPV